MSEPALSIVLPCFNAEKTIELALRSLLDQSFRSWELIAVDDGSTDSTLEVLRAFERKDKRIKVIRSERVGLVEALNVGIKQAQAELIGRQDADDESLPKRFERQVDFLCRHPEVSVLSCQVEDMPGFPSAEGYARYIKWTNSILSPREHWINRFVDAPLIHPTFVARRFLFERFGLYRKEPAWPEDFEIFLRWFEAGATFQKLPEVLYRWREAKERLSRTCWRYSPEAFYRCKAHYLTRGPLRDFRQVGVWGAGRVSRKRASFLEEVGLSIAFYIDIDPDKIGKVVGGKPVFGPESIDSLPEVPIVSYVSSPGARDLIRKRLEGTKFKEGVLFWCAA